MARDFLRHASPHWFAETSSSLTQLTGVATLKTGTESRQIDLLIKKGKQPRAFERVVGTDLPAACPERHIEADGKFCLGFGRPEVLSNSDAVSWWEALRQFLMCQKIAERTEVWPTPSALDHGKAGAWHRKCIELAKEIGAEDDFEQAHAGEKNWINDPKTHLTDSDGRPINGRTPCPKGCVWRKRGRWVRKLRAECSKRSQVIELVYAEKRRAEQLEQFWREARELKLRCCETMRDCPLKNDNEFADPEADSKHGQSEREDQ